MSEQQIRTAFQPFGKLCECDGAVDGPRDGWVMISVDSKEVADRMVEGMKQSNHIIGN